MTKALLACIMGFMGTTISCVADESPLQYKMYILKTLPERLSAGGSLSIFGGGFGIEGPRDRVYLSDRALEVLYWTHNRIDCRIPRDIGGFHFLIVQSDSIVTSPHEIYINMDISD